MRRTSPIRRADLGRNRLPGPRGIVSMDGGAVLNQLRTFLGEVSAGAGGPVGDALQGVPFRFRKRRRAADQRANGQSDGAKGDGVVTVEVGRLVRGVDRGAA